MSETLSKFLASAGAAALLGLATPSITHAQEAAGDWPEYGRDYKAWRFSPLTEINKANIKKLHPVWIHQPGDITQGLQSTPIVLDGIIYYIAANDRVFAIDGSSGSQIWQYAPDLAEEAGRSLFAGYSRGVSVAHGKVFLGTTDGRLIALDQKSGKPLWELQLTAPKNCHGCNFTSPPVVAGDVIIAGPTGGDLADQGHIYGVNLDGKLLWTFDNLKDDPNSWPNTDTRSHGGGGAWLPGQYDPQSGLFYIGISNAAPDFRGDERKGDNLYTASTLALDPKTGKMVWFHQEVPHDVWDYDSAYESLFIDKDGKELMTHLNKGGFVTVLDRKTGKVQNIWKFAETTNWLERMDPKTGEIIGRVEPSGDVKKSFCPSVLGARSWNPGAYNPKDNLWFTNGVELCNFVKTMETPVEKLAFSQPFFGFKEFGFENPPNGTAHGWLAAYDPLTGKQAWKVEYKNPGLSGVLATAGDLVFNGDSEGYVRAYDGKNGKELWKFNTGSGIRAGLVSYMAGGKQYILVPSGFGSLFPGFASSVFTDYKTMRGGAALIAFAIE